MQGRKGPFQALAPRQGVVRLTHSGWRDGLARQTTVRMRLAFRDSSSARFAAQMLGGTLVTALSATYAWRKREKNCAATVACCAKAG